MDDPLSIATYQAGMLQSRAYRKLNAFLTAALKQWQLTPPYWATLGILYTAESPLTMQQLAQALDVKPSFVARMGHDLAGKELVEQISSKHDNRIRTIQLTENGKQLVGTIESRLREDMRKFLKDLNHEELEIYLRVLGKIAEL